MSDDKSKLPASSLTELKKIIQGYGHLGDSVQLDPLAKLVGINRSVISANSGFLTESGIIEGGKTKKTTPLGKKLARALDNSQGSETKKCWQEIVKSNEFLANLVSTIRIKGGMTDDDLYGHVLYASGLTKTKHTETGARSIIDILLESAFISDKDGKIQISQELPTDEKKETTAVVPPEDKGNEVKGNKEESGESKHHRALALAPASVTISINLQIPETENLKVYENLFKALRENLLESKDDDAE